MSSQIFVIGAAGKIGRRLLPRLVKAEHRVIALHRRSEQKQEVEELGAVSHMASLTDLSVEELSQQMRGSETVVFSAGAGGASIELTTAIDKEGLEKSVQAAEKAGVKRFILVSAYPKSWREELYAEVFEHYMRVKKEADTYLAESSLDWVILRPVALNDEPGTGRVRAGFSVPNGVIRRDDVAEVIATLVNRPEMSHRIIELVEGDEPISRALKNIP